LRTSRLLRAEGQSTRKVTLPELIIPELRRHLAAVTPPGPEAFVFVHVKGGQLRRSNFTKPWARLACQPVSASTISVTPATR
jgi:hypothetical protein